MGWLEALVLGIVQGLTEFLPISSSAHQSIVGQFFGGEDPGSAFTAITQLGTEAAVIIYFRQRHLADHQAAGAWSLVGRIPRDDPEARMGWLVIIGSIPIVVLGLLFQDAIDSVAAQPVDHRGHAGRVRHRSSASSTTSPATQRPLDSLTWKHGILFGLAQSLALIPGVSRSGATITAGLALGYKREAAAKYAFLLAIPAVVGSGFFKLADISDDPVEPAWGPIILATVVAFVVGYAVIALAAALHQHPQLPAVRDLPARRWPSSWRSCCSPGCSSRCPPASQTRVAADSADAGQLAAPRRRRSRACELLLHRARRTGRARRWSRPARPAPAAARRSAPGRPEQRGRRR